MGGEDPVHDLLRVGRRRPAPRRTAANRWRRTSGPTSKMSWGQHVRPPPHEGQGPGRRRSGRGWPGGLAPWAISGAMSGRPCSAGTPASPAPAARRSREHPSWDEHTPSAVRCRASRAPGSKDPPPPRGGSTPIRRTIVASSPGRRPTDQHLHEEPGRAGASGQGVDALVPRWGFWVASTMNGWGTGWVTPADRHLALGHHLEQRRLHLGRGPVDLVGQHDVGEDRPPARCRTARWTAGRSGCPRCRTGRGRG